MNRRFHATGRVVLSRAKIKGSLILGGTSPAGPASIENDGFAIQAFATSVDQAIVLERVTLCGVVDFRQASCTVLQDEVAAWPDLDVESRKILPGKKPKDVVPESYPWVRPNKRSDKILVWKSGIYLGGLTFDILRGPDVPWEKRRAIFKRKAIDRTNPQPYLQLAKVYNQTGETSTARKVQVARLNASTHPLSPSRWILRPLIGYGYKPLRAALFLAAIALIGGFLFALAAQNDLLVPTKAPSGQTVVSSECHPKTYPCFHPYAYSVDSLLPVLNLKERDFWIPNVQQAPLVGILAWSLNGIGWIVGLLVIAGFTNIVRKE
jgi:hypothetical protein